MPQRYISTTPTSGVNFYQTYTAPVAGSPTIGMPAQLPQLGISPGNSVLGSLKTQWVFGLAGAAPVVANTASNLDATTFIVGGSGGVSGKTLVAVPANAGAWFEVTGATLNLTQLTSLPVQAAGESDADFKARAAKLHAEVGENPDGSPMTEEQKAKAAKADAVATHAAEHKDARK